ncbi:MAG: Ig-like domain-containing protein, partial [Tepidisphaeraceae bacterium]
MFKSSSGRKVVSPRVRAAASIAVESLEQRTLLAFTALINFQPAGSPVPAGYLADAGLVFADRGNGFSYGWDAANTAGLRDRESASSPDQRYDTLAHTQQTTNRTWEMAVPAGDYVVRLVAGDPNSVDSVYRFDVEGELSINAAPSANRKWIESSAFVNVADGRLTLSNAAGSLNNKINFIEIYSAPDTNFPSVTQSIPANGSTGVLRDTFIGIDMTLLGGALDPGTINSNTVKLVRSSDGLAIPANVNTSGGGDSIVLQPTALLDANTSYFFTISSGATDVNGHAMAPYSMTFTTGTGPGPVASDIQFQKLSLANTSGNDFTSVEIGPDGKLYAGTLDGRIFRYAINADGTLATGQLINTIKDMVDGPRLLSGFAFSPDSTAQNLTLYVVHNDFAFDEPPEWSGKITRLTGTDLQIGQDIIVGLPRANHNHVTNQPVFGPDGALYVAQGGSTAQGARDAVWGLRPERLLSAAVLRLDLALLPVGLPLDVQTEETPTPYNPWTANAPLKLYATGLRNSWDLVWTNDGKLYSAGNGSNPGGAVPATPPLPIPGSIRIDGDDDSDPNNGMYNGPVVPGIDPLNEGQNDYLYNVAPGGYYGHPNPSRYEFVLDGGNPTSGFDPQQVSSYPVGTLPDRNFRPAAFDFGPKRSPNGLIEYRSDKFGGALQGKLLVVRYSGGDDIIVLSRDSQGNVVGSQTGLIGLTGFVDPLDLIEDPTNGNIYVAELGGRRLSLLRPIGQEPPATPINIVASVVTPTSSHLAFNAMLGATSYRIQRKAPGESSFTDYGTSPTNSFDDVSVSPLGTYVYRVRAENSFGPSNYSVEASVTMPATGQWSIGVPLPNNMAELGGAIVNGKLYVAGENNTSTWEFDFGTQQWTALAVRPFTGDSTNAEHSTDTVGGLLYLIGGLSGGSENKVQIYNPATDTWSLGAQRSYNAGSSLSAVIGGKIYVTGGAVTVPSYQPVAKTSMYDPANDTWTPLADMPLPRHSAAADTDGQRLFIFGGRNAGLEAS